MVVDVKKSDVVVSVSDFSKSFGKVKAVKNLSFEVRRGEIFGFLGSNGSGKTTTIRCLLGIYEEDRGELLINGQRFDQSTANKLGYIPEERGLYATSKVLDTLIYFGRLKGLNPKKASKRANKYLERVELSDKAGSLVKNLSSGQQQKIQLGVAVINKPELLILDEPTRGLDPVNRALLMDIISDLNQEGSTIIYTSHLMEDVERICDRLILIDEGERVLYGKLSKVKQEFGTNVISLTYEGEIPTNKKLYSLKKTKNRASIIPEDGVNPEQILTYLVDKNVRIKKYELGAPSLEDIFIKVVENNKK